MEFEDEAVEAVLLQNMDSDSNGYITKDEAAAVTSIGKWFVDNKEIETFNEFAKFTSIVYLQQRGDLTNDSFKGCSALREITIPEQITVIGGGSDSYSTGAFRDCTSLVTVHGIERLTEIMNYAFKNCTSLVVGNILQNVVKLGIGAFYNCPNAFSALDLSNVTEFGQEALKGVSLTRLSIPKLTALPNASTSIENYGLKTVLEEIVLSDKLTNIPNASFYGYTNLSKIDIPDSVTTIAIAAFYNCTSLEIADLALPNLTSLGQIAFKGCKIKNIVNLGSISRLEGYLNSGTSGTFSDCPIESAILPSTLTYIGNYVLGTQPTSLKFVIIEATTPPSIESNSFARSTCPIYVPDESVTAYKEATNWSAYADRIKPLSEYAQIGILDKNNKVWGVSDWNGDSADVVGIAMRGAAEFVIAKDENTSTFGSGITSGVEGNGRVLTDYLVKNWGTGSVAASYCNNYIFTNGQNGYLPSQDEMVYILTHLDALNEALTIVGGVQS